MWRKRGSAKSNPRNSERCKSETARKHQNASKIQITRTQKKNTYRYEIWDQNPRKLPNLQDSPRTGIFFFCGQETRMLEWRRESKFIIVATNSLGICHCFFRKSRPYHEDLPWMRPSPIDGWSYWNTLSFLNVKSCNDGVSHSILLTEMGAMMELRLIAEGLRIT